MPYMPPLQNCGAENITPGRAKECSLAVCSPPPHAGPGGGAASNVAQDGRDCHAAIGERGSYGSYYGCGKPDMLNIHHA